MRKRLLLNGNYDVTSVMKSYFGGGIQYKFLQPTQDFRHYQLPQKDKCSLKHHCQEITLVTVVSSNGSNITVLNIAYQTV